MDRRQHNINKEKHNCKNVQAEVYFSYMFILPRRDNIIMLQIDVLHEHIRYKYVYCTHIYILQTQIYFCLVSESMNGDGG